MTLLPERPLRKPMTVTMDVADWSYVRDALAERGARMVAEAPSRPYGAVGMETAGKLTLDMGDAISVAQETITKGAVL